MRFGRVLSALVALKTTSAQTLSGLSFDGRDPVSLVWAFDGHTSGRYDFYLCAGDESTGAYASLARVIQDTVVAPGDLVSFQVDLNMGGNDLNAYGSIGSQGTLVWIHITLYLDPYERLLLFQSVRCREINATYHTPLAPGGGANLLNSADLAPAFNGSALNSDIREEATRSFLEFPSPTIPIEIERNELRKRLVDPHTIPYGEQTGLTKYAPMPKRAGTTIADRSPTPQYPPFPFSIATTYLPAPTVEYTDTAYLTWTTHSIENTAAPAAAPTLDKRMQQFLERR
ncbi:hypothetical protein N7462_009901 [Penicillium macrosclerotiorum]|uniref:uncharacterized protein n=1 Tax=Penicillium macrosclerotiorum TaxID=303699 RepID=UPI002547249A|nr:uncharacterized protein N7462_009901 [Penicillium macrosclerotiorum]KAJ5668831.1 hypothetical protein N7462_009901 [Penicillium macrosclerotiorum]